MQREILFRGKRIANNEFVVGDLIKQEDYVYIGHLDSCVGRYYEYTVSLETIGQYTGMQDKNGVKVFEGGYFKRWTFKSSNDFWRFQV